MTANQNMFISELRMQNRCKHPLVLDLGCGSGRDSARFIQEGFTMHCLDISAKSVQETFDKIVQTEDKYSLPVTFSVTDMREMHHYYKFDGV
jgi:cyclopropane fatty-acyl-phospholipid synthase-like methyltransferase